MAEAQEIAAEVKRLSHMSLEDFADAVVNHVRGGRAADVPRDVRAAALASPLMAPRTLDALETAIRQARRFLPLQEGESRKQQAARIAPFRAELQEAMRPYQEVVDDLVHEEAKRFAQLDEETFERRWTAFVLDKLVTGPVPRRVQGLAFRSPNVAARTDAVCRLMLEEPARFLPDGAPDESRAERDTRIRKFRDKVESERRLLRYAIQYAEARHGRMPAEPNVRLRALRRLGDNHPEELSRLLHEVREEVRQGKQDARRAARAIRRAARTGAR
jgi:hypothetical protein